MSAPMTPDREQKIRRARTHCEAGRFETEDERSLHVWGPSQYPTQEMCQRCTVMRWWAEEPDTDEAVLLAEVDRLRARVAELEAQAEKVAAFCGKRAEYVTNLRNCNPNADHDYFRWTGHAEARRQLSQSLGLPVAWPAEDDVHPPHPAPCRHPASPDCTCPLPGAAQ